MNLRLCSKLTIIFSLLLTLQSTFTQEIQLPEKISVQPKWHGYDLLDSSLNGVNFKQMHAYDEALMGMEAIIRKARAHNPNVDIVITYFVNMFATDLGKGKHTMNLRLLKESSGNGTAARILQFVVNE